MIDTICLIIQLFFSVVPRKFVSSRGGRVPLTAPCKTRANWSTQIQLPCDPIPAPPATTTSASSGEDGAIRRPLYRHPIWRDRDLSPRIDHHNLLGGAVSGPITLSAEGKLFLTYALYVTWRRDNAIADFRKKSTAKAHRHRLAEDT
jgi:hypothetical protein